jgi:predicted nuclease with TOPRIM domain
MCITESLKRQIDGLIRSDSVNQLLIADLKQDKEALKQEKEALEKELERVKTALVRVKTAKAKLAEELGKVNKLLNDAEAKLGYFEELEISGIVESKSSGDTLHSDKPSDEIQANLDLSALTHEDRSAIVNFKPKVGNVKQEGDSKIRQRDKRT